MPSLELGDAGDVRVFGGDQEGELAQRQVGVLHGAQPHGAGYLLQIVLHGVRRPGRDTGPLLGPEVGVVRGASARELVGQLAVEQGRFQVEQGGRQGLHAAVGDTASGLRQQPLDPVEVAEGGFRLGEDIGRAPARGELSGGDVQIPAEPPDGRQRPVAKR
ncbi:hypothetical protein [Streptomyces sp. NPDC048277]|uniref:hypothetical protein n=1 Tax=Streptomyces sp. NPDC048277 TaxID=3155027 RepID=UPI0034069FE4